MIETRVAAPEDVDTIREMTDKLVQLYGDDFSEKRFEWGIQRRLFDPLQKHGILIAYDTEAEDKLVGVIFAEIRVDPYGLSEGYIKNFYVIEEYRGKGIGRLLMKGSIEHFQQINIEKILINLQEDEPAAEKAAQLYDSLGFKKKYTVLQLDLRD